MLSKKLATTLMVLCVFAIGACNESDTESDTESDGGDVPGLFGSTSCGTYTITSCTNGSIIPSGGSGAACEHEITTATGTCFMDGTTVDDAPTFVTSQASSQPWEQFCNSFATPQINNPCGMTFPNGPLQNITGCCICEPITECPTEDSCGTVSDGCDGTIECGTCTNSEVCGVFADNVCSCPTTCKKLGSECGEELDDCGGVIDCGECETEFMCDTDARPNVCVEEDEEA